MSVIVVPNIFRPLSNGRSLLCCGLLLALAAQASGQRKRIAVLSFDVGVDAKAHAQNDFGIHDDLGRALSDVLVDRLVQDGKFIVIERAQLDQIVKEQNFSNSDRADPSTAAKIGKIAGVDAVVIGSVTEFGLDKKETKTGALTRKLGALSGTSLDRQTSTVSVATTARIVDVSTAAILASATGAGTSSETKTSAVGGVSGTAGGLSQKSSDFSNPMVAEATNKAIASMTAQLEAEVASIPASPPPPRQSYSGVIADVSGNTIIITVGTTGGVRVGDTVDISRPGKTIKNPQTGAVLKVIKEPLGSAKITEADANSATALLNSPAAVQVNDQVNSSEH